MAALPAPFATRQRVPPIWFAAQGVIKMSKGEKATLTCTPDFAYGSRGAPPDIPPGATLVFDVELISISGKPFF